MSKCKIDVSKVRDFLLRNGGFSDVDSENLKAEAELIRTEAGCAVVRFEGQKLFPYYIIPSEYVKEDKTGKVEVFATGGGFWLSAMYLDENRYAVTDNDCVMSGFCIYDHRGEDQDTDFPCQNMVGERYLDERNNDYAMTDEDRYIFFRLHNALLREADGVEVNGPWCADIIHTDGADDFPKFAYRGTFYFKTGADVTAYGVDWNSFCTDVRLKTGIRLPLRKSMKFYKLSDFEQIAGIDAAHSRQEHGCIITKKERFCDGWRASEAIWH